MSTRIKKDRRERRRADRADGGARARDAEILSNRLSDLLRQGAVAGGGRGATDGYGLPGRPASPPPPAKSTSTEGWGALEPDVDGSLPSDGDYAFARAAAAHADRAWAAAEWRGLVAVSSGVAGDYAAAYAAQAAAQDARLNAIAASAAADAAVWPADVRDASGLPQAPPAELYDAAQAGWLAAAGGLPADVRAAIELRLPVPARPARAGGLLRRAHMWAADIAAAAARPAVDVVDLARAEAWAAAPPRIGGWGDDDWAEFDELDNGVDLQAMAEKYLDGIAADRFLDAAVAGGYAMPGHGLAYRWCGRTKNLLGCRGPDMHGAEDARSWHVQAAALHSGAAAGSGTKSACMVTPMRCGSPRCRTCLKQNLMKAAGRAASVLLSYFAWRASADGPGRSQYHHRVVSAPGVDYGALKDPKYRADYVDLCYQMLRAPPIYEVALDMAPRLRAALPAAGVDPVAVDQLAGLLRSLHNGNADRRAAVNEFVYTAMRGWADALRRAGPARERERAAEDAYRELIKRVPRMPAARLGSDPRLLELRRALAVHGGLGMGGGMSVLHMWRFTRGLESAYWSPHWHFIGSGFISGRQVAALHGATGLAIVGLSSFSDTERLRSLVYYLFTHSAVARRKPLMAYFGDARGHDAVDVASGSSSGFDDVEAAVARMMAPMERPNAAYDRADLARVDMQDVVVPDGDILRSRRLPVRRIAPNALDLEEVLQGLVEWDPDNLAAGRRPPRLTDAVPDMTANAPMAKLAPGSGAGGRLSDADGVVRLVRLTWRMRARRRAVPILETWVEKTAVHAIVCDRFPSDLCPYCHGRLRRMLPLKDDDDVGAWIVLGPDGDAVPLGDVGEGKMCMLPAGACPFRPYTRADHYDGVRALVEVQAPAPLDGGPPPAPQLCMGRFFGERPRPDFFDGLPEEARAGLKDELDAANARAVRSYSSWWLWREFKENDGDRPTPDMVDKRAAEWKVDDDGLFRPVPRPAAAPTAGGGRRRRQAEGAADGLGAWM